MTAPYVMAIRAGDLFADRTYQRDVDMRRVRAMAAAYDPRLLGVLDVSKRPAGRYAILDGQHRHALVTDTAGADTPVVCQVYEGLSIDDEARLFHEINVRRKTLNFWDRWKARRASGDERVALIEAILANHQLQVHPAPADGNVMATAALEVIVDDIGDHRLLDAVVVVLLSAFGRSRAAFQGPVMEGLAYVLANYRSDELSEDRLVERLSQLPPQQLRARASGLREIHKGTLARLVGAVIVDHYNRGGGRKVESFWTRVPAGSSSVVRERWRSGPEAPRALNTPPSSPIATVAAACRCTHSQGDHAGDLAPQCHARGCTCLRYRAAAAPVAMAG